MTPPRESPTLTPDAEFEATIAEIRDIGRRMNELRARLPQDDPLQSIAFQVAAFTGTLEAELRAAVSPPQPVSQKESK